MKHNNLLVMATSLLLLASCGGGGDASSKATGLSSNTQEQSSSRTRSSSSRTSVSVPTEAPFPTALPAISGTNVTSISGIRSGGENDAVANPGFLYEWHGDGGDISNLKREGGEFSFNYTVGWAWYGCQLFYHLPYALPGDTYTIRMLIWSDIDGTIRINGEDTNLVWGWNNITKEATRGEVGGPAACTISIQLGTPDNASAMPGSLMKFKEFEIYDNVNTYYPVTFQNGNEVLKTVQVRAGSTVAAPEIDVPQGKLFSGWFAGEEQYNSSLAINAAKTFVAKFIDASEVETVNLTFKFGKTTLATQMIVKDGLPDFSKVQAPFGYRILGWYTDEDLTIEYDDGTGFIADATLYMKGAVSPICWENNNGSWDFAPEMKTVGENGEFILTYPEHSYTAGYHMQVNFAPLPTGETGQTLVFSVDYKLEGTTDTGSYQIYDNGGIASGDLVPSSAWKHIELEYEGGTLSGGNKFTLELGLVHPTDPEGNVVFSLNNPLVSVK